MCLSICHASNLPRTAHIDLSGAQHEVLIIHLLQVCYCELTRAFVSSLQWVEGEDVQSVPLKTTAQTVQPLERLTSMNEVMGSNSAKGTVCFFRIAFWTHFLKPELLVHCFSAAEARIEAGLERNYTPMIWLRDCCCKSISAFVSSL